MLIDILLTIIERSLHQNPANLKQTSDCLRGQSCRASSYQSVMAPKKTSLQNGKINHRLIHHSASKIL